MHSEIETRPTYFTELHTKRLHFFLQDTTGPAPGRVALLSVYRIKNAGTRTQIVTPGGGQRSIVDRTNGHYELKFLAADLDTDGALTIEIQDTTVGSPAEAKIIHLKVDPRGGQRTA